MAFRGIFGYRSTVANRRKANYSFDDFNILVAIFASVFFISAICIIYYFGETFITLPQLLVKYLFIAFIALFIAFFYARYRNSRFYPFILPVSFVVSAPLLMVFFLLINFYFSEPYATVNFRIPQDFTVYYQGGVGMVRNKVLIPAYTDELIKIPNYYKLRFTKESLNLSEKQVKITFSYGCFGYYVIRKKEYL